MTEKFSSVSQNRINQSIENKSTLIFGTVEVVHTFVNRCDSKPCIFSDICICINGLYISIKTAIKSGIAYVLIQTGMSSMHR